MTLSNIKNQMVSIFAIVSTLIATPECFAQESDEYLSLLRCSGSDALFDLVKGSWDENPELLLRLADETGIYEFPLYSAWLYQREGNATGWTRQISISSSKKTYLVRVVQSDSGETTITRLFEGSIIAQGIIPNAVFRSSPDIKGEMMRTLEKKVELRISLARRDVEREYAKYKASGDLKRIGYASEIKDRLRSECPPNALPEQANSINDVINLEEPKLPAGLTLQ